MLFGREGPGGDYERLVAVNRPEVGLRAITAVHSTRRGPAFGGIRRRAYRSEQEAVEDTLELAAAMSHKCALACLPAGGAKTVSIDEPQADQDAAYERLGREIEAMGGDYVCGPDVGTGPLRSMPCDGDARTSIPGVTTPEARPPLGSMRASGR